MQDPASEVAETPQKTLYFMQIVKILSVKQFCGHTWKLLNFQENASPAQFT